MINLTCTINNPFSKTVFKNLFCRFGDITKYKMWEFECYRSTILFEVSMYTKINTAHSGFSVLIGIAGYTLHAQIYDIRH